MVVLFVTYVHGRFCFSEQVMRHKRIKEGILRETGRIFRTEMKQLCKMNPPSMLRDNSLDALTSFTWDAFVGELQERCPTLLQCLQQATKRKRRVSKARKSYAIQDNTVIGLCAAIIMRHRHVRMNLVQRIISLLLYSEHTSKQVVVVCVCATRQLSLHTNVLCLVQTYNRLQKLLLCLSHRATISSVDRLGSNHDTTVQQWKGELERYMAGKEVLE